MFISIKKVKPNFVLLNLTDCLDWFKCIKAQIFCFPPSLSLSPSRSLSHFLLNKAVPFTKSNNFNNTNSFVYIQKNSFRVHTYRNTIMNLEVVGVALPITYLCKQRALFSLSHRQPLWFVVFNFYSICIFVGFCFAFFRFIVLLRFLVAHSTP